VFTRKDGQPINPNYATTRFRELTDRAGLPLQDLLGHSSIVVTADTYTSVLPDSRRRYADATAALVLAAARHTRKRIKEKAAKNRPTRPAERNTSAETAIGQEAEPQVTRPPQPAAPGNAVTPMWHPSSTQSDSKKGLSRVSAVQTQLIWCARRDSNP
jgi:hypothetical protein